MKKVIWLSCRVAVLLMALSLPGYAEDCAKATQLTQQAFDLGENPATFPEQKRLLTQALALCPNHPEAHNNFAWILSAEKDFPQAVTHYRAALRAKPDYADAWYGLGDAYQELKQFPLSLEAYLQVCKTDPEAWQKARELLNNNRYKVSEAGEILNKESLLLLFDSARRADIQRMIKACCTTCSRAVVAPEFIFRNILFEVRKATLTPESQPQIQEIGAALSEVKDGTIIISGHSDKQRFAEAQTQAESDQMNLQLSQDRAETVAQELANMGIPRSRLKTAGYGPAQPEDPADTPEAYAKNRRVTISVN